MLGGDAGLAALGDGRARRSPLSEWRVGLGGAGAVLGLVGELGRAQQRRRSGRRGAGAGEFGRHAGGRALRTGGGCAGGLELSMSIRKRES